MLVDSHCHIDLCQHATPEQLLDEAQRMDVSHMLCVCVDMPNFPTVKRLAEQHDNVFASVGVHPASDQNAAIDAQTLCELADHPEIIAIGETGLDYYHHKGDMQWQQQRFLEHIEAGKRTEKPLIIHTRDAKHDTIRMMQEAKAEDIGGVMHCFVEDWETAQAAMEMGFYISFSGIVTFKNAKQLQDVAKRVPLDRLLVETDSPYLAPMPYRGKKNQPAYVRHVAEFIAKLRGETLETIAAVTTENFFRLFSHAVARAEL